MRPLKDMVRWSKQKGRRVGILELRPRDLCGLWGQLSEEMRTRDRREWAGGTPEELEYELRHGRRGALKEAERLAWKIDAQSRDTGNAYTIDSFIAGGSVSVPSVLAGSPLAFRRPVPTPSHQGVRVWVDIAASCTYKASQLQTRGLMAIALARTLSRTRPVELIAVDGTGNEDGRYGAMVIRLGARPIDWSATSAILGSANLYRRLGIPLSCIASGIIENLGEWKNQQGGGDIIGANPALLNALGVQKHDVYLAGAHIDRDDLENPVDWVKQKIAQIS